MCTSMCTSLALYTCRSFGLLNSASNTYNTILSATLAVNSTNMLLTIIHACMFMCVIGGHLEFRNYGN